MKSIRIIKLNFVLTIFIILLHGHVPVGESKLCLTNSPLWYDLFEHFIVNVFVLQYRLFLQFLHIYYFVIIIIFLIIKRRLYLVFIVWLYLICVFPYFFSVI